MWYVLWTTTRREEFTRQMINRNIDSSLVKRCAIPYKLKRHFHGRSSDFVKILLFPSYVFVETDNIEEFAQELKTFPGFNAILSTDGFYYPISKHDEYILTQLLNDHDIIDISEGYMEGDKVRITSGPLLGQEANIKMIRRRQCVAVLEMNIFNRVTEVSVGLELLENRT